MSNIKIQTPINRKNVKYQIIHAIRGCRIIIKLSKIVKLKNGRTKKRKHEKAKELKKRLNTKLTMSNIQFKINFD